MPSISFDPIAHAYDATRGYPEDVAQQIALALAQTANATPQTTFLEVGVGTGRIAFPLASLGHIYTGQDISEKMVEQLQEKLLSSGWQEQHKLWGTRPDEDSARASLVHRFTQSAPPASMRLVIGDMTSLPFYDASFDVVMAVHVFHLVDGWQQAASEVLRVLHPGGLFLHCWDEFIGLDTLPVESTWHKIMSDLGSKVIRPGAQSRAQVMQWLQQQGLQPQEVRVTQWKHWTTPRRAVEHVTQRLWSSTWVVPDNLFAESTKRLWNWAHAYFGTQMDTPHELVHQFVISKTQV